MIGNTDVLSINAPLTADTAKMLNADRLGKMCPNSILINTARGGLIDEKALIRMLKDGSIAAAGLDVFSTEPPEGNNPLLKNDKVFLSPHTAAFTEECMKRMAKETIQNIIDFFDKKLEKSKIVKL